jgi:hypothetical protein
MPGGSGEGRIGGVGGGFVPGVRLADEFYSEVVRPLLEAEFRRSSAGIICCAT